MPELVVVIRLRECVPTDEAFEAARADYPLLREFGCTPWEAVNRLVLERRWSP